MAAWRCSSRGMINGFSQDHQRLLLRNQSSTMSRFRPLIALVGLRCFGQTSVQLYREWQRQQPCSPPGLQALTARTITGIADQGKGPVQCRWPQIVQIVDSIVHEA